MAASCSAVRDAASQLTGSATFCRSAPTDARRISSSAV
jgi:hypothetical protein